LIRRVYLFKSSSSADSDKDEASDELVVSLRSSVDDSASLVLPTTEDDAYEEPLSLSQHDAYDGGPSLSQHDAYDEDAELDILPLSTSLLLSLLHEADDEDTEPDAELDTLPLSTSLLPPASPSRALRFGMKYRRAA
jgi:hypothetical protein